MSILELIILAIVQGLTEFLPVSSSGHLVVLQEWFGTESDVGLEILLHTGTLVALAAFFIDRIWKICKDTFVEKNIEFITKLIISSVPIFFFGALVALLTNGDSWRSSLVVVIMLFGVAIMMLHTDSLFKQKGKGIEKTSRKDAIVIGFYQALSILPGTSRSGISIIGARRRGLSYEAAAEYSFLLAIPALLGATAFIFVDEGLSGLDNYSLGEITIAVTVSAVVGYLAISTALKLLKKYGFKPFAYYRIVLALIVFLTVVIQ